MRDKMQKKKYPKHLSLRDIEVVIFIAEAGAISLSTLGKVLEKKFKTPLEARGLRALAYRLVEYGLIGKERILAETGSILWPRTEALKLAGFKVNRGERADRPSLASLRHSLILAEIRLMYEMRGAKWVCERALRADFTNHLPDGLATFPEGEQVLIELELTAKESNRLRNIMIANLEMGDFQLNYWTTPETFSVVEKQRNNLPKNYQERVCIHLLPQEVYL
jgi:hypothetical protein